MMSVTLLAFAVSGVSVTDNKISNIGPANLSGVIDIENRLSPLSVKNSKKPARNPEEKARKQEKEKRRLEMEKRKEERKKEMERRRLEREREKIEREKLSSPKKLVETSVVADYDSEHEEFEAWEDVDEVKSASLSDVTVSGVVAD